MRFDTQDAAIEKLLRSRYGQWIPCYELADLALQYCRAVNSIRKRFRQAGDTERVENMVKRVGGQARGSYRIRLTADILKEQEVKPHDPPSARKVDSADWFTATTGRARAALPPPDLGPLFRETHG